MTPFSQGASMMTWCSKKINTVAAAFDFLRPTNLTYATYDKQSLVLQASVLQLKNCKIYLCFSGSVNGIDYWRVPDSLLARLR